MIHGIPASFQNHDDGDATSPLTCIQLVDLIMVMHWLSFPAFPAMDVKYLLTSQDNKMCSFCHFALWLLYLMVVLDWTAFKLWILHWWKFSNWLSSVSFDDAELRVSYHSTIFLKTKLIKTYVSLKGQAGFCIYSILMASDLIHRVKKSADGPLLAVNLA